MLVVPAARAVDGPGGVFLLDELRDAVGIELSPALVEGYPHGEGDDVLEVVDGLHGLALELGPARGVAPAEQLVGGLRVVFEHDVQEGEDRDHQRVVFPAAVDHVLPDQDAHLVAVIVPAQRLDLDVLAHHREAHVLEELDVLDHGFVGRRREKPVRVISLVEDAVVEVGFIVEPEARDAVFVFADRELPHAEVRGNGVRDEPVRIDGRDAQIIESRVFRRPQFRVGHRDGQRGVRFALGLPDDSAVLEDFDRDRGGVGGDRDLHLFLVDVRDDVEVFHIAFRHTLEPHGAPDAGLSRVPDVPRFRDLFPSGDVRRVGRIEHLESQDVFALVESARDIEGEGEEASLVRAEVLSVQADFTVVVDGREVQERDIFEEGPFDTEFLFIVERVVFRDLLFHAGELCLRGEGDEDVALVFRESLELRQDGILPRAVEALVAVAAELGAGVFGQRHRIDVFGVF